MKIFLFALAVAALFTTAGCLSFGQRDDAAGRESVKEANQKPHPAGVDHSEYPGDINHEDANR